jgi:hypothetical protein
VSSAATSALALAKLVAEGGGNMLGGTEARAGGTEGERAALHAPFASTGRVTCEAGGGAGLAKGSKREPGGGGATINVWRRCGTSGNGMSGASGMLTGGGGPSRVLGGRVPSSTGRQSSTGKLD